jgi:predicted transcriptional regulator
MATRRAVDIMIPIERYPNIFHHATIRQAVEIMETAQLEVGRRKSLPRSLIVFDKDFHPLGIVRRRDILRGLEPKFLRSMSLQHRRQVFRFEVDPDLTELTAGRFADAVREQAEQPVSSVMQPIKSTLEHDDRLAKIVYYILKWDIDLMPVLRDGIVIGVVRTVDVFHEIAQLLEELAAEPT